MRHYTTQQYVTALLEATEKNDANDIKRLLSNFVKILRRNHTLSQARAISKSLLSRYNQKHDLHDAEVVSARSLKNSEKEKIVAVLPQKTEINYIVEPTIIAGIMITIDNNTLIDATVQSRLNTMFRKK